MTGHTKPNDAHAIRIVDSIIVEAAGVPPKKIREFVGRIASLDENISIANMQSPPGWGEPPQTPDFDEYTIVLRGIVEATIDGRLYVVRAGQALHVPHGTTVTYATPHSEGAEYVAVCLPAFSPDLVHRADL
jgi:quercetin dioxygenase-like cupin family protein